ncbi:MAG TPA: type 4a pilus biogenesis protein PilO [Vicinamibacterales bacterium]|jgi:type IV pilus assembly protein PilO|nr:type 4a pilus biogenesis protein PilO [Vicinamibacterales bacterium]
MKLSLGRLPWYAQIGAFVVLAGAGVGAFWYGYAAPAGASLAERRTQLETLKGEIDRGLAAARQLPEFRRQLATEQAQLDRLRVVLPEERDVAELLRRVQAMATQSNLTILGFTPQAITTKETHAEWPIGLQVEGTYHNLGAFFERISRFPRIINVTGIAIRAKDANTASASTITADCTATTFVLIEPQKTEPEESGRGRGRGARGRGRGGAPARGRG